jgi:prepilin-type N-terminal cleavage/methylation domain-containing protein
MLVTMPRPRHPAFTMLELIVVVALIGILIGLLLPAIQMAREASRRTGCQNNLRQVGVAILNCEQADGSLPIGARSHSIAGFTGSSYGMSWWVDILGYLELSVIGDRLDDKSVHHGSAFLNAHNARVSNGVEIDLMFCPSSPLPRLIYVNNVQIGMPSYVGISGAASDHQFSEARLNLTHTNIPAGAGQISGGGLLVPNRAIETKHVTDGTTFTLVVSEASDYATTSQGLPIRVDGANSLGWFAGTRSKGTPPEFGTAPDFADGAAAYNITTIRYPPNEHNYELPGVFTDHGPNNPLLSAHPGIVNALLLSGAVIELPNEIDLLTLKLLATRDEGSLTSIAP